MNGRCARGLCLFADMIGGLEVLRTTVIAIGFGLACAPAQAAVMKAVYASAMSYGSDDGLLFDTPTDLAGKWVSVTYIYDTNRGVRTGSATYDQVYSISSTTIPVLSVKLEIDGRELSLDKLTGYAQATVLASYDTAEHYVIGSSSVSPSCCNLFFYSSIAGYNGSLGKGGTTPNNLDTPFVIEPGLGANASFSVSNASNSIYGVFVPASVVVTALDQPAPVPLPASALLLLAGLGALRLNRRAR